MACCAFRKQHDSSQRPMVVIPYVENVSEAVARLMRKHNTPVAMKPYNSHLVCDPTIRQLGFDLPRQQWSLLNHFRTEHGHCGACRRKWRLTDTDLCPHGETQTMSHIVRYCPLTKLNDGLSRLHSADEDAVSWLTSYGSWHAYEKKKTGTQDWSEIQNRTHIH